MRKISSLQRSIVAKLVKYRVISAAAAIAIVLAAIGPHMSHS